jgi:predicted hydrolase (HD superfamily)
MTSLSDRALATLHEWVQSESLRKHCYAVADSMKQFARLAGADSAGPAVGGQPLQHELHPTADQPDRRSWAAQPVDSTGCPSGAERADLWEAVGLLHDMDYERHPNQEQSPTEGHPFVGVAWLREHGWSEEMCRAILSHANYANVSRETPLERTLYAVDELSGFVIAVARVRPSKSIHEVDVAAVKKKMKDKAFARAVNRDDIVRGAAELGMPLDDVIANVITALATDAERLGLAGSAVEPKPSSTN